MKRPYVAPQVQSRPRELCLVEGCTRFEELASGRSAGGLCAAHRKRKTQGRALETPIHDGIGRRKAPRVALIEAAIALGDIDTSAGFDIDFRRALDRLTHAAMVYWAARQGSRRKVPSNR